MKKLISLLLCFCFTFIFSGCFLVRQIQLAVEPEYRDIPDFKYDEKMDGYTIEDSEPYYDWLGFHDDYFLLYNQKVVVAKRTVGYGARYVKVWHSDLDEQKNVIAGHALWYQRKGFELLDWREMVLSEICLIHLNDVNLTESSIELNKIRSKIELNNKEVYLKDIIDYENSETELESTYVSECFFRVKEYSYLGCGRHATVSTVNGLYLKYGRWYYKIKDAYVADFERMINEFETWQTTNNIETGR